jgi:hypothetical protein
MRLCYGLLIAGHKFLQCANGLNIEGYDEPGF